MGGVNRFSNARYTELGIFRPIASGSQNGGWANVTPTQAEINNGGVVIAYHAGGTFYVTQWVPLKAPPTAALSLTPPSISENGGVSTVTATLSYPLSQSTALTVTAVALSPAVSGDFTLSSTNTLTLAANATTSTGTVTVTAVDNSVGAADKSVVVSATAAGSLGVANPSGVTLTLRDDDYGLDVGAVSGPATEGGGQATFTVVLRSQPTAAVTVAVSSLDTDEGTVDPSSLTFAAAAWGTAQTVTVTGVQDPVDDGDVTWQVRLDPSSGDTRYGGLSDVDVTTTDDDGPPGVTLALDPATLDESGTGNVATVTARLSHPSGAATTVTAVSGVFTVGAGAAGVVVAAGDTTSTDTATVTAVDDDTDAPDRTATVTATVTNDRAAADSETMAVTGVDDAVDDGTVTWSVRLDPSSGDATFDGLVDVVVTTTDDDTAGVEASPSAGLVTTEGGGEATFTVQLKSEPLGTVVLDVASTDTTEGAVDTDAQMNGAQSTLTFTTTNWSSAQTVTVTGVDDALTDGDQGYTVTLAVNQALTADATYDGLGTVSVSVVNRDDEGATADVNGDGSISPNDGLLMYYAYTFEAVFKLENDLGRRVRGFLRTLRGAGSPAADDAGYKAMLDAAWGLRGPSP